MIRHGQITMERGSLFTTSCTWGVGISTAWSANRLPQSRKRMRIWPWDRCAATAT